MNITRKNVLNHNPQLEAESLKTAFISLDRPGALPSPATADTLLPDTIASQEQEMQDSCEAGRVEPLKKNLEDEKSQGTEQREQIKGNSVHAHGNTMKLPPQEIMNCSTAVVSVSAPEPIQQEISFSDTEEEMEYWYNRFKHLDDKYKKLRSDYKILSTSKNRYRAKVSDLERSLANEEQLLAETKTNHQNEIDMLNSKVNDIKASYIKSVNSVGTGLENITDEEFEPKLRALHYKVNVWSRKASKLAGQVRSPERLPDDLQGTLTLRAMSFTALRFAQLIEAATWDYIEDAIFSAWFPGLSSDESEYITKLDGSICAGDQSSCHEKSEFWRAYTISLLFQNPEVQHILGEVKDETRNILSYLNALLVEPLQLDNQAYELLKDVARCARMLAAEFRCQRAFYEVDQSIKLRDPYDPNTMEDVRNSADVDVDEDEEFLDQAIVSCIVAKRLVRRPFAGSMDVAAPLSKAKVLIMAK
ncbi:hypothetical protein BDD12DRAFT_875504 [Trichophaea hybrida]|nr:hypothetical protein BDD12DRAFT_875504 [Trichophaea hybrida]